MHAAEAKWQRGNVNEELQPMFTEEPTVKNNQRVQQGVFLT